MGILKTKFGPGWLQTALLGVANGVASLGADGKIPLAQIPAGIAGGLNFKGSFDASTGSYPTSPSNGDLYIVTVAGTISGVVYTVGDLFFYASTDSSWKKIETSRTTDELPEGTTNLFFTVARAKTAAVINSLTGGATDQAPSVAAVAAALALKQNSFTRIKERFTLSATDVTNGYVILSQLATANSIVAGVQGLGLLEENANGDYTTATDGGTGKTKLTWVNALASAGAAPLAAGDVIYVQYTY